MNCPTCRDERLVMSERHGIEIDYCPRCRGIWLDRGELDKIIQRASAGEAPPPARERPRSPGDSGVYPSAKPRKHWILELLD